jgi:hypothetical protein
MCVSSYCGVCVCPHAAAYGVSAYCCVWVSSPCCMCECPHTAVQVSHAYASQLSGICRTSVLYTFLILLCVCPHTAVHVSPHTAIQESHAYTWQLQGICRKCEETSFVAHVQRRIEVYLLKDTHTHIYICTYVCMRVFVCVCCVCVCVCVWNICIYKCEETWFAAQVQGRMEV